MDYRLEDLIDIPLLQNLLDKLNLIYSVPSAIIDNDGKILTVVAWQDICTKFHRANPECEKECIKSDQYILEHLSEENSAVSYQCPHGLIDNATPIIIDGKHLGNFFTGQFFLEKPDLEYFKKQSKIYGFDEKAYLEALEKVPIWTKDRLIQYLDFIKEFVEIIEGTGLKNLKVIETNRVLKESEERYRAIIQSTSDWIWETDEQGKYCYCSDRIERILGFTADEIIGKSPFDLMPQDESERVAAIFQKISEAKDAIVDLENWNLHKDGHKVCLLTNGFPIFDETGKITGYRGADKDITERKQTEEEIQKLSYQIALILESLGEGVYGLNTSGVSTFVNPAAAEMLGYTKRALIGKFMHGILHHSKADGMPYPQNECPIYAAFKDGKEHRVSNEVFWKKDGTSFPVEYLSTPIREHGILIGAVVVFKDITKRKQAENALNKKMNELQRFHDLTVDRELNMIELKKEVNELLKKSGQKEKYRIVK